jgi:outer membrane protein assembly factor BamE
MRASRFGPRPMRVIAIVLACLAASGCGRIIYKLDVQQGNYVTQDVVDKVKLGMTKAETRQLLGTPLLNDVFHADRWDYYYSSVKRGNPEDRKRFTIVFKDDKIVSFGGDAQPPALPPVGVAPDPRSIAPPPAGQPQPAAPTPAPKPPPSPDRSGGPLPSQRK